MLRATPSCRRPAPLIRPCGRADGERVGTAAVIARISAHPVRSSSHGKVETTACLRASGRPRPTQRGADLFGFAPIARVRRRPNDLGCRGLAAGCDLDRRAGLVPRRPRLLPSTNQLVAHLRRPVGGNEWRIPIRRTRSSMLRWMAPLGRGRVKTP